jgi:hypothetical protein
MRFFLCLIAVPVLALAQVEFRISGSVTDASGLPIPGATVTVTPAGGAGPARTTQTDVQGKFSIANVPRGAFTLEAGSAGFLKARRTLQVSANISNLQLRLNVAGVSEQVTVTAEAQGPAVAPEENADALELDPSLLNGLPVLDQDVIGAATEFLDEDAMGSGGASIVVDGMEVDELGVSPSAIAEVRVNKNPYSAEFARPGRGRIEVITKEGSDQFHGSLFAGFRDARMNARNAFSPARPPQQRRYFEGHLTGPVAGSPTTTFLVGGEYKTDERQQPVFATLPGGLLQESVVQPERGVEMFGRINRYIGEHHVLSWRYSYERDTERLGLGGFNLPESAYDNSDTDHIADFGHRWFPTPNWYSELRLRYRNSHETNISVTPGEPRIIVNDAFTRGGAQQSWIQDRDRLSVNWIISHTQRRHSLRWGVLMPVIESQNLVDRNNFGGTYVFASLADYEARRPLSYRVRTGTPDLQFSYWRGAAFIQDDFKVLPRLTLGLGVRYESQSWLHDRNNLAPRFSIAWGLGAKGKTVIRAGSGIFYSRLDMDAVSDVLQLDGMRIRDLQLLNPAFPVVDVDPEALATPPNVVRLSPNAVSPYLIESSIGIEHQFTRDFRIAAAYRTSRGNKFWRALDRNPPLPPLFARPQPEFGFVRQIESSGTMKVQSLQITASGRMFRIFRGQLQYRLGEGHNDTDGLDELPPDSTDLRDQWARASWDRRHRFRAVGVVELPRQFSLGIIYRASTGRPYEWTTGRDMNNDGLALERPPGVGRNALNGPGESRLDLRVSREFRLAERKAQKPAALTFSLDAFNVLNTVNYTRVVGNESSPFFGQPVASAPARRLQISARLEF